jgi:hypothetical protein
VGSPHDDVQNRQANVVCEVKIIDDEDDWMFIRNSADDFMESLCQSDSRGFALAFTRRRNGGEAVPYLRSYARKFGEGLRSSSRDSGAVQ